MATDWEFGPYYWEEGQERPESLKERCRQRFWWLYEKNLRGAEFVGEVVANLFGLTESKYQWIIDAQRDEERREKQRKLEDSQRRMLAERARAEREATRGPSCQVDVIYGRKSASGQAADFGRDLPLFRGPALRGLCRAVLAFGQLEGPPGAPREVVA